MQGGLPKDKKFGFTIVELLIVIVVIGILAAITIVAYNGINERAKFSKLKSDLKSLNMAIKMYHADNDAYPIVVGWRGDNQVINDSFIPGLVPKYISKTPQVEPSGTQRPSFLYTSTSTGSDYKLIYIVDAAPATLPALQMTDNPLIDPTRTTRAWGYWSPGGVNL